VSAPTHVRKAGSSLAPNMNVQMTCGKPPSTWSTV
jgi:hypothetical protein